MHFHYSLSIDVLGEVIARAGGAPLPDLVAKIVTAPLGLRDTGFASPSHCASPLRTRTSQAAPRS